ncbi:exodeoxyribonuclease V subunit alpha [Mucilaginibacter gossypii]|uniref:RecBCD enzyme subunit RecD n=1 Tax=Mucilaginibacter gossypii TaxID=551996 RepID=A0A1G8B6G3_9SPHI|nr:exodeoxyribonuclease V subunit alpha [Mucilaginibacter gossypii]SDH28819.1 DNA helicase/exodeoxyribonuclease V, alpha subunit [Mucilaginibacter gossypii]
MLQTTNDVHQQFAGFFNDDKLYPYAYEVSKKLSEGHICIELSDSTTLSTLSLVGNANELQPFILHKDKLYLQRYFSYETMIRDSILAFKAAESDSFADRTARLLDEKEFILQQFPGDNGNHTDWQLVAALSALLNNFTIITGGPGTGKTTTVAKLLAVLYRLAPDTKVALAAPTGKAAMRMGESLRKAGLVTPEPIVPKTLHRLLQYVPGAPYFKHDAASPLPYDVVIVDEASMIDAALFAKLLDAVGKDTRLILLGDKDQLASVEAGSLLGDLCKMPHTINHFDQDSAVFFGHWGPVALPASDQQSALAGHVIELQISRRFNAEKGIGRFSKALITNDTAVIDEMMIAGTDPHVIVDDQYDEATFEKFVSGYEAYIQEPDTLTALRKFNAQRILCPVKGGEQGVNRVNRRVEEYLRKRQLINPSSAYYVNRPVMITANYYELDLFNGDTGLIRPDETGTLKAWFETTDGELRGLWPAYLPEPETVFAMTVHKSQGSEYEDVFVMLPKSANESLMTRELLYTAVTRAKQTVTIQGSKPQIQQIASTSVARISGLAARFEETLSSSSIYGLTI